MNIMENIVSDLAHRTDSMMPLVTKAERIQADIDSRRFSAQTTNNELIPQLNETKARIEAAKDEARQATEKIVSAYIADLERQDALNPAELTDDCKLLTAGVPLTVSDLKTMLDRNTANRTMTQIILRYAREHHIDLGIYYIGNEEAIQQARGVPAAVKLYIYHWMDKPNAGEMLKKLFEA